MKIPLAKSFLRSISILLVTVLVYESVATPLAQASLLPVLPSSTSLFSPAPVLGEVAKIISPPSSTRARVIYHFQDIHNHLPSQTNLAQMISDLEAKASAEGKSLVVGVEGASGKIDSDRISAFPKQRAREAIGAGLLRCGFLFGEEYAAITHAPGRIKLIGIEDAALYKENVSARDSSIKEREIILAMVKETKSKLQKLIPHYFQSSLDLLEQGREKKDAGSISTVDYIKQLVSLDPSIPVRYPDLARLKRLADQEKMFNTPALQEETARLLENKLKTMTEKERTVLLKKAEGIKEQKSGALLFYGELLGQSNFYPTVKAYLSYLSETLNMDTDSLIDQIESAEKDISSSLLKNEVSKYLYDYLRYVEGEEKFFSLSLTPQEWKERQWITPSDLIQTQDSIQEYFSTQLPDLGYEFQIPSISISELKKAFQGAHGFYEAAQNRDGALGKNIESLLKKYDDKKTVVAFIAGGFHTPGITNELCAKGFECVVIRPQLETQVRLDQQYRFSENLRADYDNQTDFKIIKNSLRDRLGLSMPGAIPKVLKALEGFSQKPVVLPLALLSDGPFYWGNIFKQILIKIDRLFSEHYFLIPTMTLLIGAVLMMAMVTIVIWNFISTTSTVEPELKENKKEVTSAEEFMAQWRQDSEISWLTAFDLNKFDLYLLMTLKKLMPTYIRKNGGFVPTEKKTSARGLSHKPITISEVPNPPIKEDEEYFIFNSMLAEATEKGILHVTPINEIEREVDSTEKTPNRPNGINVRIIPHDAIKPNFGKASIKTEEGETVERTAKGDDLKVPIPSLRGERSGETKPQEMSVSELKLLQVALAMKDQGFSGITYQPFVGVGAENAYLNLRDRIAFDDPNNPRPPMSYRQFMALNGIELERPLIQNPVPTNFKADLPLVDLRRNKQISADEKENRRKSIVKATPRKALGHAQVGFNILFDIYGQARRRKRGIEKKQDTVSVVFNGTNINTTPNPKLIKDMVKKRKPIVMVTTSSKIWDVAFVGWLGVRAFLKGNQTYTCPEILEAEEAQGQPHADLVLKVGQKGGVGREGAQLTNSNMAYYNESLLGDILVDLVDLLKEEKSKEKKSEEPEANDLQLLAEVLSPRPLPRFSGEHQEPFGTMSSVILNLNAFLLTNLNAGKILKKHGIERLVHFVKVPNESVMRISVLTEFFALINLINLSRIEFDRTTFKFKNNDPNKPFPIFNFQENPEAPRSFNLRLNAGKWGTFKVLKNLVFKRANINELQRLDIYGPLFDLEICDLIGHVAIYNETGLEGFNLITPFLYEQFIRNEFIGKEGGLAVAKSGRIILKDVKVILRRTGADWSVTVTPISDNQPISWWMLTLMGFSFSGLGFWGSHMESHPLFLFGNLLVIGIGFALSMLGILERIFEALSPDVNGKFSKAKMDSSLDKDLIHFVDKLKPGLEKWTGPFELFLTKNIFAVSDHVANTISLGSGLLAQSNWFTGPIRKILIMLAFVHEAAHLKFNKTGQYWRNEAKAYPVGLAMAVVLFFTSINWAGATSGSLEANKSYLERAVTLQVKEIGANGTAFNQHFDNLVLNNKSSELQEPHYVNIDFGSLEKLIDSPAELLIELQNSIQLFAGMNHRASFGSTQLSHVMIHFPSENSAAMNSVQQFLDQHQFQFKGVLFHLVNGNENAGPKSLAAMFEKVGVPPENLRFGRDGNVFVLSADPEKLNQANVQRVFLQGMSQLAPATLACTHFKDPLPALGRLLAILKRFTSFREEASLTSDLTVSLVALINA